MEWIIGAGLAFILILPRFLIHWSVQGLVCKEITDKPFFCPNCGHKFYVKWYQMWFKQNSVYAWKSAKLKCPNCGITDMCRHDE